jgi:hypothetical protein
MYVNIWYDTPQRYEFHKKNHNFHSALYVYPLMTASNSNDTLQARGYYVIMVTLQVH